MKKLITLISLTLLGVTYLLAQSSGEADEILGIWLTGSKKGKVEIYKCGDEYCGKIVWLRDPLNEDGSEKRDKNNPDPKLRSRKILGMNILTDFEYDDDMEWDDGEIYDPDNGKLYSCVMNLQKNKKTLEVRGYIGISLIGRTELWVRSSLD